MTDTTTISRRGPTSGQMRSRTWCLTLNNWTAEWYERLQALCREEKILYLCLGKEVGSQELTPHLQGYLELPMKKTLSGLKKLLGIPSIHLEIRKGSQDQAINYCKKDGKFLEQIGTHVIQDNLSSWVRKFHKEDEMIWRAYEMISRREPPSLRSLTDTPDNIFDIDDLYEPTRAYYSLRETLEHGS